MIYLQVVSKLILNQVSNLLGFQTVPWIQKLISQNIIKLIPNKIYKYINIRKLHEIIKSD